MKISVFQVDFLTRQVTSVEDGEPVYGSPQSHHSVVGAPSQQEAVAFATQGSNHSVEVLGVRTLIEDVEVAASAPVEQPAQPQEQSSEQQAQ